MTWNEVLRDLVDANHILANEGVLDGYGHVSIRHPEKPERYLLSCSKSPDQVEVGDIIEYLSSIVELLPGDVIFTGTPGGVGVSRKPPVFLKAGDVLISTIDGIGTTTNHCIQG